MNKTIQERFEDFHEKNPHVYYQLVNLTNQAYNKGRKKIGIGMLFEVLRWNNFIHTDHKDYKMCNDYRSRYARKIMADCPHLGNMFNLRELTTE
jgi:hypothetical protein